MPRSLLRGGKGLRTFPTSAVPRVCSSQLLGFLPVVLPLLIPQVHDDLSQATERQLTKSKVVALSLSINRTAAPAAVTSLAFKTTTSEADCESCAEVQQTLKYHQAKSLTPLICQTEIHPYEILLLRDLSPKVPGQKQVVFGKPPGNNS